MTKNRLFSQPRLRQFKSSNKKLNRRHRNPHLHRLIPQLNRARERHRQVSSLATVVTPLSRSVLRARRYQNPRYRTFRREAACSVFSQIQHRVDQAVQLPLRALMVLLSNVKQTVLEALPFLHLPILSLQNRRNGRRLVKASRYRQQIWKQCWWNG